MISALLNRYASQLVIAGVLFLAAAVLAFGSIKAFRDYVDDAVLRAENAKDAVWRAEIANAEVVAANNIIAQLKASQAADKQAQAEITRLKNQVSQLEDANAALSDTAGSGIDADRTRLLNNQYIGGKAYSAH